MISNGDRQKNKYKVIIFDWDGTLVDSTARIVDSMQMASVEVGMPQLSDHAIQQIIGLGLPEALKKLWPLISEQQLQQMRALYSANFSTHSDVSVFYGDELISHQKKDTYEFWIPEDLWNIVKGYAGIYKISTDWSWLSVVCNEKKKLAAYWNHFLSEYKSRTPITWKDYLSSKSFYIEKELYEWLRTKFSSYQDLSKDYIIGDTIIDIEHKDIVYKITKIGEKSLSVKTELAENTNVFGLSYKERSRFMKLNNVKKVKNIYTEMPRSFFTAYHTYHHDPVSVKDANRLGTHYTEGKSLFSYNNQVSMECKLNALSQQVKNI